MLRISCIWPYNTLFSLNFMSICDLGKIVKFNTQEIQKSLKIPRNREINCSRKMAHDFLQNLILVKQVRIRQLIH